MVNKQKTVQQQEERLSTDVIAFCDLVARIIMRCLRENNPEVLNQLSLLHQEQQGEGENHVPAA